MAFVMFLACLFHVGFFNVKKDLPAVGLIVFDKYMKVVRKLQMTYRMEPAGSQGVRRILPLFRSKSLTLISYSFQRYGPWTTINSLVLFGELHN